jgi:hypothetical protein
MTLYVVSPFRRSRGNDRQNIHALFFDFGYGARAMNEGRKTITTAVMADLEKSILAKKTGLAAGNNFLIDDGSERSALVANRHPRAYLAINWQRTDTQAQFTSGDRRFPTPQPTTSHLFWPNQRRRAVSPLPIWLRNFDFPLRERRRGGQTAGTRQNASTQKRSRNFVPNKSTLQFA